MLIWYRLIKYIKQSDFSNGNFYLGLAIVENCKIEDNFVTIQITRKELTANEQLCVKVKCKLRSSNVRDLIEQAMKKFGLAETAERVVMTSQ